MAVFTFPLLPSAYKTSTNGYYSDRISSLGYKGLNHGLVRQWTQNTGPSNWGDYTNWGDHLSNPLYGYNIPQYNVNGVDSQTVYYYFGIGIYYSVDQYNYWTHLLGANQTQLDPPK